MYEELKRFFEERDLYFPASVLQVISAAFLSEKKPLAFLLRGPPATGKTSLAEGLATFLKAKKIFLQCTLGTDENQLLYNFIPSEETKSGIKMLIGALPEALIESRRRKVVLVIDELDKSRPQVDGFLLDFLENARVSIRIREEENLIIGNPDNLIVCITSNDEREFSEPLIRRLIHVRMKYLPPEIVTKVLNKKLKDERIITLLVQLYIDTIQAKLRKPATIQELLMVGKVLKKNPKIDFNTLVQSFIIKYDDDWEQYIQYINSRQPYKWESENNEDEESIDISSAYEVEEEMQEVVKNINISEKQKVINLNKIPIIRIKEPEIPDVKPMVLEKESEFSMAIEENDKEAYTEIIQELRPEPTDDPRKFGKFQVLFDNGVDKTFVVSKEPLNLTECLSIKTRGEFYFEDDLYITKEYISTIIKNATKVHYYTRRALIISREFSDELIRIRLDVLKGSINSDILRVKIRGYIKGSPKTFEWIQPRGTELVSEWLKKHFKSSSYSWSYQIIKEKIECLQELQRKNMEFLKVLLKIDRSCYPSFKITVDGDIITLILGNRLGNELKAFFNIEEIPIDDPLVQKILDRVKEIEQEENKSS